MPSDPAPDVIHQSLQAENEALRAQIHQLHADRTAVAERQKKAGAYEQSQVCFRTVFEHSPLDQKIITADLLIRQVNPALVALLGLTRPDEVQGRRILEFAHPHYRSDWHDLQERLRGHHIPTFTFETCLLRADGTSFWCQVHSILFPNDGEELGYTTLVDTTAKRPGRVAETPLRHAGNHSALGGPQPENDHRPHPACSPSCCTGPPPARTRKRPGFWR